MKIKSINKSVLLTSTLALVGGSSLIAPSLALAQYAGVQQVEQIAIVKQVENPATGVFTNNISSNTFLFLNNQAVVYKLIVTNPGSATLNNIKVQDVLPSELNFTSSVGIFDPSSHSVNFTIGTLNPGQEQDFLINATTVVDTTKGGTPISTCPVNTATATVDQLSSSAQATICIGPQILNNVTMLPKTGPSETGVILAASLLSLMLSVFLFKVSF